MTARVLIVDDEKTFRMAAQAGLAAEGYDVRTAASGGEGLNLARAFAPDVVILDRNLPDADGLSVLARLREEGGDDAPLVVMATVNKVLEYHSVSTLVLMSAIQGNGTMESIFSGYKFVPREDLQHSGYRFINRRGQVDE